MILQNFLLAFPLFFLVGLGSFSAKVSLIDFNVGKGLAKFAFNIAIPCLLFHPRSIESAASELEHRIGLLRLVRSGFSAHLFYRPKKFSFAR